MAKTLIALCLFARGEACASTNRPPAWPVSWDADFKLHLAGSTIVSGNVESGKLADWTIKPAARMKDAVVHQPPQPSE